MDPDPIFKADEANTREEQQVEVDSVDSNPEDPTSSTSTSSSVSPTFNPLNQTGLRILPISSQLPPPISRHSENHSSRDRDRTKTEVQSNYISNPQPWTQPEHSVVRNRQGSVLTRGLVLKTDHFAGSARPAHLSLQLQGAPNFRKAACPLEVYGVAQPTITGLKTILCVLGCQPNSTQNPSPQDSDSDSPNTTFSNSNSKPTTTSSTQKCVWVCTREEPVIYVGGRPFVLREASIPTQTFGLSGRAHNLEGIESRLKSDILRESKKYGGMLMVHEEIPLASSNSNDSSEVKLTPTWVAIDSSTVLTLREVFTHLILLGWNLEYHRIPIASSSLPENSYLDAYTKLIRDIDPRRTSFVANCGVGFTRTTFAMVAACIVRRKQMMLSGEEDPFGLEENLQHSSGKEENGLGGRSTTPTPPSPRVYAANSNQSNSGHNTPSLPTSTPRVLKTLQQRSELEAHNSSLLRLINIVSIALTPSLDPTNLSFSELQSNPQSSGSNASTILLSRPSLLTSLMAANSGEYGIIKQLCSLLDDGVLGKKIVDFAIDACSQVTNLREAILLERIRGGRRSAALSSSTNSSGSNNNNSSDTQSPSTSQLSRATSSLEKYFFLIAFSSYVSASQTAVFEYRFANWLRNRGEIWGNILRIRRKEGRPFLFDPVGDLSGLVNPTPSSDLLSNGNLIQNNASMNSNKGEEFRRDEFAEHLVTNRGGIVLRNLMLLKCDVWKQFIEETQNLRIRGVRQNRLNGDDQDDGAENGQDQRDGKEEEQEEESDYSDVRGTVNFRRVPKSNIFATGQPTTEGISNVLRTVREIYTSEVEASNSYFLSQSNSSSSIATPLASSRKLSITWLNLREEPIVYLNGKPYCLRQRNMSLRNLKEFSGISCERLELLEERLKNDVLNELENGEGRLLLHNENNDGDVVPVWEEVEEKDVETIAEVMRFAGKGLEKEILEESKSKETSSLPSIELIYRRIPITAEKPPDFSDISELLQTVLKADIERSPIILNCQLGRGRSTLTSIIVLLIERWLKSHGRGRDLRIHMPEDLTSPVSNRKDLSHSESEGSNLNSNVQTTSEFRSRSNSRSKSRSTTRGETLSYHVINSLLRVIPKGLEVKRVVDTSIDQCSSIFNLRDSIEEARLAAEEINDDYNRRKKIQSGIHNLRRYFELLVFQAYLANTPPDTLESQPSFETFVKKQPVFETISKEFEKIEEATLRPLQKVDPADGMALDDEVQEVVQNRKGSILSAYTMLKSDFFSGIVKMSLPDKIPGIPNLRGVSLLLGANSTSSITPRTPVSSSGRETWGSGMPTVDGLRKGLERIGSIPNGNLKVVWTSLREEPVLYVNGRPHVLRLADQPLTNVEATGVTTDVVERMEVALKADVLAEAKSRNGRVLLHDEVEVKPGSFDIIPVWETVQEGDVLTPREVYEMIVREGYKVDYARVAVTDEQAPVPAVFSQLEERVSLAVRTNSTVVFNCQMGRGRTTTGMVIASLVSTVRHYSEELFNSEMSASFVSRMSDDESGLLDFNGEGFDNAKDGLDNREDDLWLQGEYRSILQLVGVLSQGKLAKKLTDKAIDRMEAVQNLRRAIYDSKLRASNADPGSNKARHLSTVFTNYLQRYGYLIAFANYLLEKSAASLESEETEDDDDGRSGVSTSLSLSSANLGAGIPQQSTGNENDTKFPTFLTWLKPRREITQLLTARKLV